MLQPGRDLDLPEEPLAPKRGRELGAQDLEGDVPLMAQVFGKVNRGHAPTPHFADQGVAGGERILQAIEVSRHGLDERMWPAIYPFIPGWGSSSRNAPGR